MTNISYSTGVKEYVLNGDENNKIRINVTDANIVKRFEEADKVIQSLTAGQYTIDDAVRLDKEIRKQLNYTFGTDVCTAAFGDVNCLSPVADGRSLFEAFIEAFLPQVKKDIESAGAAAKIRLDTLDQKTEKYTSQLSPDRSELIKPSFSTKVGADLTPEQKMFLKSLLENE